MRRVRQYLTVIGILVLLIISLLPELSSRWDKVFARNQPLLAEMLPEDTIVEYIGLDSAFLAEFTPLESGEIKVKDTILFPQKNTSGNTPINTTNQSLSQAHHTDSQITNSVLKKAKRVRFRKKVYDTYIVDLEKQQIQLFWKDEQGEIFGSIGDLYYWLQMYNQELLFATNAGMYTPENAPRGLYVEDGIEKIPLDLSQGQGNFYLKPNGVFLLGAEGAKILESSTYPLYSSPVYFATQSGPLLLINGKIHPKFTKGSHNLHIRSGVGLIDEHKVVFIISRQPVNFYDFASLFKYGFKCKNALYLDGAISQMYLPELGRFDSTGNFGGIIGISKYNEGAIK